MPNHRTRMLLTSLLLVSALGLSFTVGALALDGEASGLSSRTATVLAQENAAAVTSTASTSNAAVGSPSDTANNSSADDVIFDILDSDDDLSDFSAVEANSEIALPGDVTGSIAFSIKTDDIPDTITPGMSVELPVYLSTSNLQLWYLKFSLGFNSDAMDINVEDSVVSYPENMDGISIEINNEVGNAKRFTGSILTAMAGHGISAETPLKICSIFFTMGDDADAWKALSGKDANNDGYLDFQFNITELVVSKEGSGIMDDQKKTISGSEANTFSPAKVEDVPVTHVHSYLDVNGEKDPTKAVELPATCTTDGKTVYTCDLCGNIEEEVDVGSHFKLSPDGTHTWDLSKAVEILDNPDGSAACRPWLARVKCSTCGAISENSSDPLEGMTIFSDSGPNGQSHASHTLSFHPGNEPTATEDGNIPYFSCDLCNLIFKADSSANEDNGSSYASANNICSLDDTLLPHSGSDRVPGDANADGDVNARDVTRILRYLAGTYTSNNNPNLANSDVNGDGDVNARDVTRILRYLAGTYTSNNVLQ